MNSNHFQDYTVELTGSLRRMSVTDRQGEEIGAEAGIVRWVQLAKIVRDEQDGTLYFIGNGASATIAEHMVLDALKAGKFKTGSCSETAYLTAVTNDLSPEDLFSFKLKRCFTDRDMLVTTSSSGNSPNIIKAIETARQKNGCIVTLSALRPENQSRQLGDLNFYVPTATYGMAEVAHALLMHCWLDAFLDEYEGGRR